MTNSTFTDSLTYSSLHTDLQIKVYNKLKQLLENPKQADISFAQYLKFLSTTFKNSNTSISQEIVHEDLFELPFLIIGCDEVGRGCTFGSVVGAAACLGWIDYDKVEQLNNTLISNAGVTATGKPKKPKALKLQDLQQFHYTKFDRLNNNLLQFISTGKLNKDLYQNYNQHNANANANANASNNSNLYTALQLGLNLDVINPGLLDYLSKDVDSKKLTPTVRNQLKEALSFELAYPLHLNQSTQTNMFEEHIKYISATIILLSLYDYLNLNTLNKNGDVSAKIKEFVNSFYEGTVKSWLQVYSHKDRLDAVELNFYNKVYTVFEDHLIIDWEYIQIEASNKDVIDSISDNFKTQSSEINSCSVQRDKPFIKVSVSSIETLKKQIFQLQSDFIQQQVQSFTNNFNYITPAQQLYLDRLAFLKDRGIISDNSNLTYSTSDLIALFVDSVVNEETIISSTPATKTTTTQTVSQQIAPTLPNIAHQDILVRVQELTPSVIDEINILQASLTAMSLAVNNVIADLFTKAQTLGLDLTQEQLYSKILVLVDGNKTLPNLPQLVLQLPVVGGDSLVREISVASIFAKTYRDELIIKFNELKPYQGYGLNHHKGYPTVEHTKALQDNYVSLLHRFSYAPIQELVEYSSSNYNPIQWLKKIWQMLDSNTVELQ